MEPIREVGVTNFSKVKGPGLFQGDGASLAAERSGSRRGVSDGGAGRGRQEGLGEMRLPKRRAHAPPASSSDAYRGIDFRKHPELYRVGRGEQGVLSAEPYKSELLPLWRFRTEAIARKSCVELWKAFVAYRKARDFVGMDMARKFFQMGYTRARRYARHRSGRKYDSSGVELPETLDREKEAAAAVFREGWDRVKADRIYRAMWAARAIAKTSSR
ncbi:MAG: hypothetical protein NVS3B20_02460 [Polyangiales bacterium]